MTTDRVTAVVIGVWFGMRGLGYPMPVMGQWLESLPPQVQNCILWAADHEEDSLQDWNDGNANDAGGWIFNTGG